MPSDRLLKILLVLLIIIASIYLAGKLWAVLASLEEVLLISGLGWLVAYVLEPVAAWLGDLHAPGWMRKALERVVGEKPAAAIANFRMGRSAGLAFVYLGLAALIVLGGIYLVPLTVEQITQLSGRVPDLLASIPDALASADAWLAERDLQMSLSDLYDETVVQQRAEVLLGQALQYLITAARAVASVIAASLLVLAVSFYIMLDGRRLVEELSSTVPQKYQDELAFASRTVDRVFGGFVRGQALMAILYGGFALIAMLIAGMPSALVIGWLCGLIMLIPLVGAPVAMVLPSLIALYQQPGAVLWLFIAMTLFQQVLLHFIIPRIMSEAMGLPTLLIMAATLLGVVLMGFWGLIFGVPVVAVFYALAVYFLQRAKMQMDEETQEEPTST